MNFSTIWTRSAPGFSAQKFTPSIYRPVEHQKVTTYVCYSLFERFPLCQLKQASLNDLSSQGKQAIPKTPTTATTWQTESSPTISQHTALISFYALALPPQPPFPPLWTPFPTSPPTNAIPSPDSCAPSLQQQPPSRVAKSPCSRIEDSQNSRYTVCS